MNRTSGVGDAVLAVILAGLLAVAWLGFVSWMVMILIGNLSFYWSAIPPLGYPASVTVTVLGWLLTGPRYSMKD
jgi:hypothetical protein